jgi:hypothetical protein
MYLLYIHFFNAYPTQIYLDFENKQNPIKKYLNYKFYPKTNI